ncbi:MAG TPA: hypothetical protein VNL39_16130 [Xanthobacteraceae bacterium]|nr:hypothetical protein [Xanthobacteraceae bacterium]
MFRRFPAIDLRAATAVALLGVLLAGCSEHYRSAVLEPDSLYIERRETISPLAGDALYANSMAQAIDPWSRASANKNIAFSGEKMQAASERYRTGRVIPPVNAMTSTSYSQQAAQGATGTSSAATSVK